MRYFYAVAYAYGRVAKNNGNRADYIHRFASQHQRRQWLDRAERDGMSVDPLPATHKMVQRALRAARSYDGAWPVAVQWES